MNNLTKTTLLCMVLALAPLSHSALASGKWVKKMHEATVSLQDAVTTAETAVSGKAYKAELDRNSFGVEYEVELLVDGKRVEVSVDATTNEVLKVRQKK